MATMFAIIKTGGKQYVVSKGDTLKIEKLSKTAQKGDSLVFDKVLLVDDGKNTTIGTPYIKDAKVTGTLLKSAKGKKVDVLKYLQKSRYYKLRGHRQPFFEVKIDSIS